jgi:phosphopantetheine--protein transferase-like protein
MTELCKNNNQMSSLRHCIRWAMNASQWKPTRDEWLCGMRCVQSEEQQRINRFVFKKDAKLALIGRLMMRKAVNQCLSLRYNQIRFGRSDRGKPIIIEPVINENNKPCFDFNISHSGDYCVLAVSHCGKVGVDVMKIEYSGRDLKDFFRIMNRQFSDNEWSFINSGINDSAMLSRFIRLWCLKESYVKAEGIGISYNLKRISFNCKTPELKVTEITRDTVVTVDGKQLNDWIFEECLIDNNHCVSVASINDSNDHLNHLFKFVTINDLLKDSHSLNDEKSDDQSLWQTFAMKPEKP